MSKKTARERFDEMDAIGLETPHARWGERMRLYQEVLGEESEGMTPYQWFHYLELPWDEKKAYSDEVKKQNTEL
jgi:hypothetical protein